MSCVCIYIHECFHMYACVSLQILKSYHPYMEGSLQINFYASHCSVDKCSEDRLSLSKLCAEGLLSQVNSEAPQWENRRGAKDFTCGTKKSKHPKYPKIICCHIVWADIVICIKVCALKYPDHQRCANFLNSRIAQERNFDEVFLLVARIRILYSCNVDHNFS